MTAPYSVLHFLVDGICAYAMFGHFAGHENRYLHILLYNFCAFALQMPFGVVLDRLNERRSTKWYQPTFLFAVLGVALTCIGALMHPVVLGIGNALFHLGGGVGTIYEDEAKDRKGRGLGVFVAPGALGLYMGTLLAKNSETQSLIWIVPVLVAVSLCVVRCMRVLHKRGQMPCKDGITRVDKGTLLLVLGCFLVVILRSYVGMAVSFSWKNGLLAGIAAVLAVVLGKIAGGFSAAGIGIRRTVAGSLLLSALCYLFSENMVAGVLALFFFNMTMPITLYLLVQRLRGFPGFSFGLLTFGLFLGFLPTYLEISSPLDGRLMGCLGSMVSLGILWLCIRKRTER